MEVREALVATCDWCFRYPLYTWTEADETTSAVWEEQVYDHEQVDESEGGAAVSEPTYMEVGAGGDTFQLKENEAYADCSLFCSNALICQQ